MKTNPNKKSILVIDNDLGSRILITAILKEKYSHIIFASSSREALIAICQSIDLIFIELHTIGFNYHLITRIKSLKPEMPLVVLTASTMNNEREKSLEHGCDAFISKPFNSNSLSELCKELISNTVE
jgi:CheY-like chemotaxis protein